MFLPCTYITLYSTYTQYTKHNAFVYLFGFCLFVIYTCKKYFMFLKLGKRQGSLKLDHEKLTKVRKLNHSCTALHEMRAFK